MASPLNAEGVRRLHLVRHGETAGESSIRYFGRTDVPLSDLGRRQMAALARAVAPLHAHAIVHSPLQRAAESARILAEGLALSCAPEAEDAFREIDFGAFEGLTREEIARRDPVWFAVWQRGEHERFPGGEAIADFAARVRAGLQAVLARTRGDVLVVAHRGVIRQIARCVLPEGGDEPAELASLSTVRLAPPAIERWNVTGRV